MTFMRNPNQQDLSWFIDMKTQKRLELDPPYQRKSVWTYQDKQFFLDTILNNYPCPAVYLQKENTDKGPLYNVVDGKQRLSTILDFHDGKIKLSKKFGIEEYREKKFHELPEDAKGEFYNYIFMVEQIRSDVPIEWGEVFQRVNKNQKTLADQELRHARFDGWLIQRAEAEVEKDFWKTLGIASKSRKARMKDAEFVSILMLVILEKEFVGFPQDSINELYAKYDFNLNEIPEDEAELNVLDDIEFENITNDFVQDFEVKFSKIVGFIREMENNNNCITKHKKRLFTDFYSLWAALVFNEELMDKGVKEMSEIYAKLISEIDELYLKAKSGAPLDSLPKCVLNYFNNSTGAATEVEPRKQRNMAIMDYVKL